MTAETPPRSGRVRAEVWLVLGLSLGQSAVYAVVSLVADLTRGPIRDATATLNSSQSDRQWLDATLQLLGIGFALVPVALALYLLSLDEDRPPVLERLGLRIGDPRRDLVRGAGLAALIGLPGLGLYAAGRALGVTAEVVPVPDTTYWWTVPILVLSALQNALSEEIIVVGFLMTRLRELRWGPWAVLVTSAVLRGSYHLYQGFGPAAGNAVMGLVFGYWFQRTGRVLPLVVAHALLDIVAFVGYLLFADSLGLR
ncbi:CPBP family intramembrane glutamic endopeptidase [Aeromicrobium terrae]|uniref:CPBP family intramembrane metalloprotease n=1 Tax=Aeromicrobium terrae TaxID=2498846 RepID=A0A5C8NQH0_9ACTN|nr:CPBP family intramembrane glutamic endopeptidase [Aeromicrobium terrae]TXL63121.1 CPBP family intramembrane metalloprotease [Aeromicrobium terrae]